MFKYEYVEEDSIKEYVFLMPGKCTFEVVEYYEQNKKTNQPYTCKDKNGVIHPALMVKFLVKDSHGKKENLYDFIFHWKLRALMTACNMGHLYSRSGMINPNILKKRVGSCEVDHEENPPYKKKNVIKKYLKPNDDFFEIEKKQQEAASPFEDDEVPF